MRNHLHSLLQYFKSQNSFYFLAFILLNLIGVFIIFWKPFYIDDTLFLKAAHQIAKEPLDYYGFIVNWDGFDQPMFEVTKNPPLAPYIFSAFGVVFGWTEWALHLPVVVAGLLTLAGLFKLSDLLQFREALPALLALSSPYLLISMGNVMSDVFLISFLLWTIIFWVKAADSNSITVDFLVAGGLMSLAFLTKYAAICFLPILIIYSLIKKNSLSQILAGILLPFLTLIIYRIYNISHYGVDLLFDAGNFSKAIHNGSAYQWHHKFLISLMFYGGAFPISIALTWVLTTWRMRGWVLLSGGLLSAAISSSSLLINERGYADYFHSFFFSLAGVSTVYLIYCGAIKYFKRPAAVLLIGCILIGFGFTTFANWSINARTVLISVPFVAILMAVSIRQIAYTSSRQFHFFLFISSLISLWVFLADFQQAKIAKTAAAVLDSAVLNYEKDKTFMGHWGFQYYMEERGWLPNNTKEAMRPGALVAIPFDNTDQLWLQTVSKEADVSFRYKEVFPATTMNYKLHSGFYCHYFGCFPYVINDIPDFEYYLLR